MACSVEGRSIGACPSGRDSLNEKCFVGGARNIPPGTASFQFTRSGASLLDGFMALCGGGFGGGKAGRHRVMLLIGAEARCLIGN